MDKPWGRDVARLVDATWRRHRTAGPRIPSVLRTGLILRDKLGGENCSRLLLVEPPTPQRVHPEPLSPWTVSGERERSWGCQQSWS